MCGEHLRLHARRPRVVLLISVVAASLICYAVGIRGLSLIVATGLLYIPLYLLAALAEGALFPRLELDKPKYGDADFHITGVPSR